MRTHLVAFTITLACTLVPAVPVLAHTELGSAGPTWTRNVTPAQPSNATPIMLKLPDGALAVRSGGGVVAIDARGATRWSMPDIADAIVVGGAVIFRRSTFVFAVRDRDAGVLWKLPCADPPYLAAAGARIVTMCGGVSTVVDATNGRVLAQHEAKIATSPPSFSGARSLNDDYVLVANDFDGAWLGVTYYVVDARSGAFLWGETDAQVLEVTPTTIALTPYPSMLPWGPAGFVKRVRLADGTQIGSRQYDVPVDADAAARGRIVTTSAATYVTAFDGQVFRYPGDATRSPRKPVPDRIVVATTLGAAVFLFVGDRDGGSVYLDRPSVRGGFETRRIGGFTGNILVRGAIASYADFAPGAATGRDMAVLEHGAVHLYDEFGSVAMSARSTCLSPQIAATRATLFVLCNGQRQSHQLSAFALR